MNFKSTTFDIVSLLVETIKLGGQKYQYNDKFKLYLATTLPQVSLDIPYKPPCTHRRKAVYTLIPVFIIKLINSNFTLV